MKTFIEWLWYFIACIVIIAALWYVLLAVTNHQQDVSGPPHMPALDYQYSPVKK